MVKRTRMRRNGAGKKRVSRLKRQTPNYIDKFKGKTITYGKYHSWKVTEDGKNEVTLGNLTDAGWFWDGGDGDMVGYLIRIKASKIRDEFVKGVKGEVDFNDMKPVLLKDLQKNDGLYQISGDNRNWKFGEQEIDDESAFEAWKDSKDITLTPEQEIKLKDDVWDYSEGHNYENFEKRFENDYRKEMAEIINKSNSFEEFFANIEEEDFIIGWIQNVDNFLEDDYRQALEKAYAKMKSGG